MDEVLRQKVEKRAYELFLERGGIDGYHIEDWIRAEKELSSASKATVAPKKPAAPVATPAPAPTRPAAPAASTRPAAPAAPARPAQKKSGK